MQRPRLLALLAVLITSFGGCGEGDEQRAGESATTAGSPREAAPAASPPEALGDFQRALKSELLAALEEGPVAAVEVCAVRAPALAAEHSGRGVAVGRASDRLRNPANAPPEWVAPVLAEMLANPADAEAKSVVLADDRRGWVEPIRMQGVCLTCHGSDLAPPVAAAIDARYPEDEARGYGLGNLRGVFWATAPTEARQR